MTTTVHLPPDLLERLDVRAKELRVSRSHYVRRALETAIENETCWSNHFLRVLSHAAEDRDSHEALDDMMRAIARGSRKRPPEL